MFDCFGVRFVPPFSKKAKLSKWPKSRENRTNMDIILSFLAKSVDRHGITLVHITYPPGVCTRRVNYSFLKQPQISFTRHHLDIT